MAEDADAEPHRGQCEKICNACGCKNGRIEVIDRSSDDAIAGERKNPSNHARASKTGRENDRSSARSQTESSGYEERRRERHEIQGTQPVSDLRSSGMKQPVGAMRDELSDHDDENGDRF